MRIGSLFTGSGMLDIAVARHFGGEVVWHAERDKHASALLAARFPRRAEPRGCFDRGLE